jgi:fluoride exporter
MIYFIIGLAGICGALLRYGIGLLVIQAGLLTLWATLPVNLTGSFMLGAFACYSETIQPKLHPWIKAGVATGFLGAFTTFSTFSLESMNLLRSAQYLPAALYIIISLWGGLGSAWAGWAVITRWGRCSNAEEGAES